jgi:TetR/AcrR family transcriptional repressor of nem operon
MRVSREQMVENRARILREAGRLFRDRGFAAVTVADVMKAAGQTHGGFYSHFASKDDLIATTIAETLSGESAGRVGLKAWTDAYLSPRHRDDPAHGCPTASLAGLMRQQTPAARAAMATTLRSQIARFSAALAEGDDAERRRAAIGRWSAMVGAVVLARAVDDPALADELLAETRAWLATTPVAAGLPVDREGVQE